MANPSLHPLLHYLRRLSSDTAAGALDDTQLLRQFLSQRDEAAFSTIVQRYGAMVWALCVRRLGETPEAEDAFQATFLVLVRKAHSLRGPELLGPWLYGVAYRTALKLRGRRARQAGREAALPEAVAEERPEQVWSDVRPILDEEVNRLPTKYRQAVLLCYLQGLSGEEAAQRLGCARGTIFSRLARARELLRHRLSKRGVGVSSAVLAAVLADHASARILPPAPLLESTIRTSLAFAAGTASSALSAPLAALVEGVLRSMFLTKVKFAVIVVLVLGIIASGAGLIAQRGKAEPPLPKPVPAPPPERPIPDGKVKIPPPIPEGKEPEIKPRPAKTPEERMALLKLQADLAKEAFRQAFDGLSHTRRFGNVLMLVNEKPEEVYIWSIRWLQAQRKLSPKKEDQVAALVAHFKRMAKLRRAVGQLTPDLMPAITKAEVEWYLLEAELWLGEAKAAK